MAIYTEIVSAGALKRKKYEATAENSGTYVITVNTQTKQALIDGNEFETDVELNDLEFVNAIKQKSNLKGWRIAIEVNNGTTILVGKIIGVIQQEVSGIARTICSCLMSNGAYLTLSVDKEGETLSATLNGNVIGSNGLNIVSFSDIDISNSRVALQISETDFAKLVDTSKDCQVVIETTDNNTLVLRRIEFDSDIAIFGGTLSKPTNNTSILVNYTARFSSTPSGTLIINEIEANVDLGEGEYANLRTLKIGEDIYIIPEGTHYFSKEIASGTSTTFEVSSEEWVEGMNNDNVMLLLHDTTTQTYYTLWKTSYNASDVVFSGENVKATFVKSGTSYSGNMAFLKKYLHTIPLLYGGTLIAYAKIVANKSAHFTTIDLINYLTNVGLVWPQRTAVMLSKTGSAAQNIIELFSHGILYINNGSLRFARDVLRITLSDGAFTSSKQEMQEYPTAIAVGTSYNDYQVEEL